MSPAAERPPAGVSPESSLPAADQVPGIAGLRRFENLTGILPKTAAVAADAVLRDGWTHNNKYSALHVDGDIPWDDDTPQNRSWNFTIHCLDMLQELLFAHSSTGNREYLEPAIAVSLRWAERHRELSGEGQSHFAWYDMAVGLRAQRLAYVLDAGTKGKLLTAGQAKALAASLELHRQYLADDANIVFHNNHGFYQAAGQLAMGRRMGAADPAMAQAREQGLDRFRRMLDAQFTAEGVHKEHSPDYHRMVYDSLRGILDSGLVDDPDVLAMARRIEDSLAWFVLPTGDLAMFGDTDLRSLLLRRDNVGNRWRHDAMRFIASGGKFGSPPEARVRAFEQGGYFIARDRWPTGQEDFSSGSYLAQIAAFHSRTHKHADSLSFVWYDRGQELLVDAGRYGYLGKAGQGSDLWNDGYWYSDPNRVYCESTRAHNTVEIDGLNHQRKGVKPFGSAIGRWGETAEGLAYCETEIRHFRSIRHARVLILNPSRWLLVFDWLQDNTGKPHDFRQWFHFSPGITLLPSGLGYAAHVPSTDKLLRVQSLLSQPVAGKLELGTESPRIQGFYSPGEKQLIPNYALPFEALGTDVAGFATLLSFSDETVVDPDTSNMARSGRNAYFRWRMDGEQHVLKISRPAEGDLAIEYTAPPSVPNRLA